MLAISLLLDKGWAGAAPMQCDFTGVYAAQWACRARRAQPQHQRATPASPVRALHVQVPWPNGGAGMHSTCTANPNPARPLLVFFSGGLAGLLTRRDADSRCIYNNIYFPFDSVIIVTVVAYSDGGDEQ